MSELPRDPETMRSVLRSVRSAALPSGLHVEAFEKSEVPSGVGQGAESVTTFAGVDDGVPVDGNGADLPSELLEQRLLTSAKRFAETTGTPPDTPAAVELEEERRPELPD